MAARRGSRVTVVNPWIPGGEGQLRDLFPLPPWLFLTLRAITTSLKHYLITSTLLLSLYLWVARDWGWFPALILLPLTTFLLRSLLKTLWLWYHNPTIPLISRRH